MRAFPYLLLPATALAQAPVDLVDPLIGTTRSGQTFPAAGVPFGMTQWAPQTRDGEAKCVAPYYYEDTRIQGFRGTHAWSGSCVQDYGTVTLMPLVGEPETSPVRRASAFRRQSERATPYSYAVTLEDSGIRVEMTATERAGLLAFAFPAGSAAWVVLHPNQRLGKARVQVLSGAREIAGENPVHRIYAGSGKPAGFSGYFVARFEKPFIEAVARPDIGNGSPGALVRFPAGEVARSC